MSEPTRVIVFDTTLRDGEQAPGFSMDVPAKLLLARALDALGVDIIEAGFPIASPADAEGVRQVSCEIRRPVIAALARCREQDIDEAARALAPAQRRRIHTFLATSDLHIEKKLRTTREACLAQIVSGVRRARNFTDDVEFSAEDATRSDRDFLCRVIEAVIREGCSTVNLPDLHFHDLRHTGGTLSAATGASLKELMARLGHSSVRAAMMYQHATRDRDRVIALALGDLIRQAADKPDQASTGSQWET